MILRRGDLGEVGAFGEPKAEEAVGVLAGAFLPGGVGVSVVDGGAEDAFEGGVVEKLVPMAFRFLLENSRPNLTTCHRQNVTVHHLRTG